ncbi:MAG: hypothetical protein ABR949_05785 [Candidatus Aquilonibacter sp.]|jgi:hypothetical protein
MNKRAWLILIGAALVIVFIPDSSPAAPCDKIEAPPLLDYLKIATYVVSGLVALAALFTDGIIDKTSHRLSLRGAGIIGLVAVAAILTGINGQKADAYSDKQTDAVNTCLQSLRRQAIALASSQATVLARANALSTTLKEANSTLQYERKQITSSLGLSHATLVLTHASLAKSTNIQGTSESILDNVVALSYPFDNPTAKAYVSFRPDDPALGGVATDIRRGLSTASVYSAGSHSERVRSFFFDASVAIDAYHLPLPRGYPPSEFGAYVPLDPSSVLCTSKHCDLTSANAGYVPMVFSDTVGRLKSVLDLRGRKVQLYLSNRYHPLLKPITIIVVMRVGLQQYELCSSDMKRSLTFDGENAFVAVLPTKTDELLRFLQPGDFEERACVGLHM